MSPGEVLEFRRGIAQDVLSFTSLLEGDEMSGETLRPRRDSEKEKRDVCVNWKQNHTDKVKKRILDWKNTVAIFRSYVCLAM